MDHKDRIVAHQRAGACGPEHRAHRRGHALVHALGRYTGVADCGVNAHTVQHRAAFGVDQNADQRRRAALRKDELLGEARGRRLGDLAVEAQRSRRPGTDLADDMFEVGRLHPCLLGRIGKGGRKGLSGGLHYIYNAKNSEFCAVYSAKLPLLLELEWRLQRIL